MKVKYKGQIVKVLVEGPSKKNPKDVSGTYFWTHKIALFRSDRTDLKGKFDIKVYETKTWTLYGELVEE